MLLWVLLAISCLYAVDHGDSQTQSGSQSGSSGGSSGTVGFIYFLLLVSFFWTSQGTPFLLRNACYTQVLSWSSVFATSSGEERCARHRCRHRGFLVLPFPHSDAREPHEQGFQAVSDVA